MIEPRQVLGVVLAGGQSRRMGGNHKALLPLGGKPLIEHVAGRLRGQVGALAVNTNQSEAEIRSLVAFKDVAIFADTVGGFAGPLAGIHAGLQHAATMDGITHIATAATDTPFFPVDMVAKLSASLDAEHPICMATSHTNRHPVFALWPVSIADDLERWLGNTDTYKVIVFAREIGLAYVDFTVENGQDPYFNINTPEDLSVAQKRLATQ